jgi:membrane protease YdiL (CAAX protease family)
MTFIRLPLALIGNGIVILAYRLAGSPVGIAAGLGWSTLTMTIVNLISIALLIWRGRVEGIHWREIIGFRRERLLGDLVWGLLWSLVLGGLLLIGIFATVLAFHGTAGLANLGSVFAGNANFSFELPLWLAVVSAILFPLLTAPVEEVQYRGYAQPHLIVASGSIWAGMVIAAVGFGLQHIAYALTVSSAVAFAAGFFLWGLGAGVIARRQHRLVPLIIAHFISNLSFGIIPLLIITTANGT